MELSEIKEYLRNGDQGLIASMSGSSKNTVSRTLRGIHRNKIVLHCAEIVANNRKQQMAELAKKDYLHLDKES